ncbi:(S)-norcoclaurine synthase [Bertholletia excelsa]
MKFWPTTPYQYGETLETYSQEIKELAVSLLGFIAMALGLQGREVSKAFQDGRYDVRMNCYPPCPEPERVVGGSPHADICAITFLLDCGDVAGLQVLKDGQWVWVKPIAGTLIVDLGTILEIMSNGIYKANFHRAMVNKCKERLSVATFCYPSSNVKIEPAKELVKAGSSPLYKSLTMQEYLQSFYDLKLAASPFMDTLKL